MATFVTPQQQAAAAAALLDAIRAHQIVSYVAMASSMALLYDFFVTLPDEVKYMWPSKLSVPKALFLILRYYSIVHTSFAITYHVTGDVTGEACMGRFKRDVYSSLMIGVIAETITYVRVYAFSGRRRWVAGFLSVLFIATHVVQYYYLTAFTSTLRFATLPVDKHIGCIAVAGKTIYIANIFVAILCSLAVATVIMIYTGYKNRLHSGGTRSLMRLFYRDGIFYFVSLSTLAMTNIIVVRTAPQNGIQFIVVQAEVHLISILAGRMLIHLRQWAHHRAIADTGEYVMDVTRDPTKIKFAPAPVSTLGTGESSTVGRRTTVGLGDV